MFIYFKKDRGYIALVFLDNNLQRVCVPEWGSVLYLALTTKVYILIAYYKAKLHYHPSPSFPLLSMKCPVLFFAERGISDLFKIKWKWDIITCAYNPNHRVGRYKCCNILLVSFWSTTWNIFLKYFFISNTSPHLHWLHHHSNHCSQWTRWRFLQHPDAGDGGLGGDLRNSVAFSCRRRDIYIQLF